MLFAEDLFQSIDHNQQVHEIAIRVYRKRLQNKYIASSNIFPRFQMGILNSVQISLASSL